MVKKDSQLLNAFRDTYEKAEKADQLQDLLHDLHTVLAEITARLGRQIGIRAPAAPARRRRGRRQSTRRKRTRLTPEQKQELARTRKLRGEVHKLVIRAGRLRNVSPAKVYQDLRQFGASNREATLDELEKRKAFLTKEVGSRKK